MLFQDLARKQAKFDAEQMAIDWCDRVDGETIFPKIPVYLRTHFESWKKNQRVQDAVAAKAADLAGLRAVNQGVLAELMAAPGGAEGSSSSSSSSSSSGSGGGSGSSNGSGGSGGGGGGGVQSQRPPLVQQPPPHLPIAPFMGIAMAPPRVVGGMQTAFMGMPPEAGQKRKARGGRPAGQKDKVRRAPRTCKMCREAGRPLETQQECPGRGGTGVCNWDTSS